LFRAFVVSWLAIVTASVAAQSTLTKRDRGLARTMLRQVYEDVRNHYYDPAFHGVDLDAQFRAAEQQLPSAPKRIAAWAPAACS
jgi:hypothetical protein